MDDERDARPVKGESEPSPAEPPEQPEQPEPSATTDPWTLALLVFFVALIGVVAALMILPGLGA
jgi:hypothetical protein